MGSFFRNWWRLLVTVALLFAAIQIFVRPSSTLERAEPVRAAGVALFRPFYSAADILRGGLFGVWNRYVALVGVARENERLRKEVAELRERLHASRDAVL